MPINAFSDEQENQAHSPYKDPLSAQIVAGLAIFWLVAGIAAFIYGIYLATTVSTHMPAFSGRQAYSSILGAYSFLLFFAAAVGCWIISAFFFVLHNMACDIHRSEHHLRTLLNQNQKNHIQIMKQFKYIDDSITRQSSVIIRQNGNNRTGNSESNKSQYETNAHDGAF